MTGAHVFWEYAKYAVALLFMFSLLRSGRWKPPLLALTYFILLLPSATLTLAAEGPIQARQALSFNLSGPLVLMLSVWFFSRVKFPSEQLQRLLVILLGPIAGVVSIAVMNTLEASSITFGRGSNFITSGGFGPNQVSAILGLGVLASSYYLLDDKVKKPIRAMMFIALLVFAAQSALTLSRGGLYVAAGAAIFASPWLLRGANLRSKLIIFVPLLFLVINYIILPRLETFTGGALLTRFRSLETTGRDRIVWADLQIWQENSLLGVGPGQAKTAREELFESNAAHTEFSRLLAEHGVLGLGALMALLLMGLQVPGRTRSTIGTALATMFACWSFLYMAVNAMRLVAPAFIFGLACSGLLQVPRTKNRREGVPEHSVAPAH
jgi:O-antigen ligase